MWNNSSRSQSPGSHPTHMGYPSPGVLDMKKPVQDQMDQDHAVSHQLTRPSPPSSVEPSIWPGFDAANVKDGISEGFITGFGLGGSAMGINSSRKMSPPEGNNDLDPSMPEYFPPPGDLMISSNLATTHSNGHAQSTSANISSMPYPYFTNPTTDLATSTPASLYGYSTSSNNLSSFNKTMQSSSNRFRTKGKNVAGKKELI